MHELFDVGPDSLHRFLVRWHGPPDREAVLPGGTGHGVPRPLREWIGRTSAWSKPLTTQNHLLDQPTTEDDKLVFWVENQGVWLWAADRVGDDPPVHDRENLAGEPWRPTGVSLSTFLLHVAVFEAIMGSPYGAAACWVTPAELDSILAPLRPLPMPAWRWPTAGHRLHAGEGLLAFAGPNFGPDETAETATARNVWVTATEPRSLEYLVGIEGVGWDAFRA